jgi:hypothetical protein
MVPPAEAEAAKLKRRKRPVIIFIPFLHIADVVHSPAD